MTLSNYRTLGRSGLMVSPLALGTMTFGQPTWGVSDQEAQLIFNSYLDAGGNFVDTADVYSGGRSESLIGQFVNDRHLRDQVVLATKFSFNGQAGNPNGGGNGRKNLYRAVEGSLRRLNTDYIDMYWMHVWDMITPAEEVLQSLNDLVRAGKILYYGFSNTPAWYVAKVAALAQAHGVVPPIAQQLYYSLANRTIEQEHIPAAQHFGQGVVPWSPLAYGFLTGKYSRDEQGNLSAGNGRLDQYNPMFPEVTEQHWQVLDALRAVASETDYTMAQVALAWVVQREGVSSALMGVSHSEQLRANIASLNVVLTDAQRTRLNEASAPDHVNPYTIFTPPVRQSIFGGHSVTGWPAGK